MTPRAPRGKATRPMVAVAAAAAAVLAASCSGRAWADGRREGSSGAGDQVARVAVVVEDGRIVDVECLEGGEGHALFEAAFAKIEQAVVARQTWDVDAVAGATVSSDAIKAAVRDALR